MHLVFVFFLPWVVNGKGKFSAKPEEKETNFFEGMDRLVHFGPPGKLNPGENAWDWQSHYSERDEMAKALPYAEMNTRTYLDKAEMHYLLARNYLLTNRLKEAMFHYNWALYIDKNHRENDVSKANIGHISQMFDDFSMKAWNKRFSYLLKEAMENKQELEEGDVADLDDEEEHDNEWEDYDEAEDDWVDGDVKLNKAFMKAPEAKGRGSFSVKNEL